MPYIKLKISKLDDEYNEILIAELSEIGYDSFLQTENRGIEAYIEETLFDETKIKEIQKQYTKLFKLKYKFETMIDKNWNELWEADYSPVEISKECRIIAHFHTPKNLPYEIIITPKMSFGTGHHQTTTMVCNFLLELDRPLPKKIVDAGTGTGILAILAEKLGAEDIFAFDVEEWAVINARENAELNNCKHIKVEKGTIADFGFLTEVDILTANIQSSVLHKEMEMYAKILKQNGLLIMSGFYTENQKSLTDKGAEFGLDFKKCYFNGDWCALTLRKK